MPIKIFTFLIIVTLITVVVAGFFMIGTMNHSTDTACPLSLVLGDECLVMDNALAMISHHVSGLQDATQFTVSDMVFSFVIFIMVFFSIISYIFKYIHITYLFLLSYGVDRDIKDTLQVRLLRWISLHNKRDYMHAFWAYNGI